MSPVRRVLFTAAGGHGHLHPLLPLAERAQRAGHHVLITGAASLAKSVARRGMEYVSTGPDLAPVHAPLVVRDLDRERQVVVTHFVNRLGQARAADVLALLARWQPDVVVRDEVDFGAAVASETVRLPHAAVVVLGAGGFIVPALVRDPLNRLRADFGLRDADGLAMLHRHLTLTAFPATFRHPADPLPGRVLAYQHASAAGRVAAARRRVFVTLGTIFNTESGDLLRRMAVGAAGAHSVDEVLVATGEHVEPSTLQGLPANVVVEQFVDQEQVLESCASVISHAGSGTVLGALRRGLPTVNLPLGADQHLNATRLHQLGAGLHLAADTASPEDIRSAVNVALGSDALRHSAQRLAHEIRGLPDLDAAVRAITDLASR